MMNRATRSTAVAWGVILGISGMSHGFFEALQGNTPTTSLMINAIGEQHRMWSHGAEPALTIIPNMLFSGLASMVVGLALVVWAIRFLHRPRGVLGFLALWATLVLVGGGIAQVLLFPAVLGVATRIHKPLSWWRTSIPQGLRAPLAAIWPGVLATSSFLLLLTLFLATFGYFPGVSDPEQVFSIMIISLVTSYGLYILSLIAGFARDIEHPSLVGATS